MSNAVLFGSQLFAGVGWPEEHSHIGPVRMLEACETKEIREKIPRELRMPFIRYTFGVGFRYPSEIFRHVDVVHSRVAGWIVHRVDIFVLHRMAVAHRYGKSNGILAAQSVKEVRARTVKEMIREVKNAFPEIELPPDFAKRIARTKMSSFPVNDFSQVVAPTTRPSDCRVRRCSTPAENPAHGGVLCTECCRNMLQYGIELSAVLETGPAPIVSELGQPGWILGLAGYPGIWFSDSASHKWRECVARGRFLASGLIFDELPWMFTTRRPVELTLCRALIEDGTAIARIGEIEATIKLALRLDRGPQNAIRITEMLRAFGVAKGPLLLNVDGQPDQQRIGVGAFQLRERSATLQGGGLTLMTVGGVPLVVMSHAVIALARLLNLDRRGIPFSYSVHEGRVAPKLTPGSVEIDAAVGFSTMAVLASLTSEMTVFVRNAHALTFGMLYHLVLTPASVVFSGSKVGKYGFRHAGYQCDLGQAWYCVITAAAEAGSNGAIVESGDIDFDDVSLRSMLSATALGPCSVCKDDVGDEGAQERDHFTDLLCWANFSVKPKWFCAAPAILRQRTIEMAFDDCNKNYLSLKSVAENVFG